MSGIISLFVASLVMSTHTVLAAAIPEPSPIVDKVRFQWRHDKALGRISADVYTSDMQSKLTSHSLCTNFTDGANIIDWDGFTDTPFTFNVNQNGAGTIQYGDMEFNITGRPETNGGIDCGRTWSMEDASIDCIIPWLGKSQPKGYSISARQACLPDGDQALADIAASNITPLAERGLSSDTDLVPRQVLPGCTFYRGTILVGNGNPKPAYFYKQLSEPLFCGKVHCTVGYQSQTSYAIGFQASATLWSWISGGFSVEMSQATGMTNECQGDPGDTVCVWKKMGHTAYTVQNAMKNSCGGSASPEGGNIILKSPNKNNAGGRFECRAGRDCGTKGHQYWG